MIEIKPEGIAEVRAAFKKLVPELQQQALNDLAQVAFDTAQRQVDTHTQTGALARSLRLRPDGDDAWIIDHDTQHAPHAVFVHWGTRAHDIRPRDKKVLRWTQGGGNRTSYVFARFVRHPGYEGDPWLVTAAEEAIRQFDRIVSRL
ncbi:MAG: hypothetical protein IAF00_07455 [Phycisphaerales bacterium]|nr:hypothetical protein [Phycisphaerales bacterium]